MSNKYSSAVVVIYTVEGLDFFIIFSFSINILKHMTF